uniref:Uncharacterized protein n=1 Tax=Arundo donax TaxID=35708 RepID=A0A0A9BTJ4_ARUDO
MTTAKLCISEKPLALHASFIAQALGILCSF